MREAGHLYIIYSGFLTLIHNLENQRFSLEPPYKSNATNTLAIMEWDITQFSKLS